ncbi:MAG: Ni/Fe hydrogenase subunit alpha [Ketobacteraceae bacterium]|nr:Ni/Fe hydrogenase subunit alpha [Ketobacteraceae bacterium]
MKKVVIEPVTRVEGHGKVTLHVDDAGSIQEARLHIVEFRGFERFIEGRPYWELPLVVQRLCGICPVSHHLAAGKAIDQIAGVTKLTPAAEKLRRLMHWGQTLQSHALHFFHLASPDLLFGFTSDVERRNIVGVIEAYPDLALQGVRLRKYGQDIIRAISGKKIHGIAAVPGGMNRSLEKAEITALKQPLQDILQWSQDAVDLACRLYDQNGDFNQAFAALETAYLSLVNSEGEWEIYDGNIRVKEPDGSIFIDQYPCNDYFRLINEEVKSWSYMKFPFLVDKGTEKGWYRVGPLARVNNCQRFSTPLAEACRQTFIARTAHGVCHATLAYHWARMIEVLHCAEAIAAILDDPDLMSRDLVQKGARQGTGIGVIEAPRGTLFHHYEVNENDQVTMANLIVSTTSNNRAMNESIRKVANDHLSGQELTPELLNLVEVAIRAYDPCLSCATHSVGKMPLILELTSSSGEPIDKLVRNHTGEIIREVRSHEAV